MTGEHVRKVLAANGVKITELAVRLGESQSNTSSYFSAKDIKTGTLSRISEATGIPIYEFFGSEPVKIISSGDNNMLAGNKIVNNMPTQDRMMDEIIETRKQLAEALRKSQEQGDRLLAIVEKMR